MLLLSTCTEINDFRKKLQNCSIYSSIKWMDWAPINSKESTWTIFLLLRISTFSCMTSIFWMATLSKNLRDEVCRNTTKLSECSGKIIIYVMRTTLMQSSNVFAALIVTFFSTKLSIWSAIELHAVNEWKMSIRRTYIESEKLSLTSWTLSVSSGRVNKNSSKI